jgi:two-component system, OmpR family, sensor histidine kinase ArlS
MPVRIRITLLFASLVFVILVLVCGGVYFFSYQARIASIKTRLTNRALTTARLLNQREIFDQHLVQRIDSLTTLSLKNKTVQAYDDQNNRVYAYSDVYGDTLHIGQDVLEAARSNGDYYFLISDKEAVAYYYTDANSNIVVISAAEDLDGRKSLRSLFNILVTSFVIGTVLVLVSGYFFSKGLLQPVRRITEDVEMISAHNLSRRIHTGKSEDEWHQLAYTLNNLLNRLQESFDLQRRFISNASHELSTPLTAISSQIEVSLQRERGAEAYKQVLMSVHQDVLHMNKLTQTLLEFAKASGDPGGLDFDLIRLDEIVLGLPAEMARIDAAYMVKIEFVELPENEEKLLVFGNETLLSSAIKNIVLNACKYSDDHVATVQLKPIAGDWAISIQDRGNGIPREDIDKIFQPFYRGEENRNTRGFGLGLSLAGKIIKIHKGSIEVQSHVGTGSLFIIKLPAAQIRTALKSV